MEEVEVEWRKAEAISSSLLSSEVSSRRQLFSDAQVFGMACVSLESVLVATACFSSSESESEDDEDDDEEEEKVESAEELRWRE